MPYNVEYSTQAARQFRRLPSDMQRRLQPQIDALAANPRPPGAAKLKGAKNLYRIRVGTYRVKYIIRDERLVVTVINVGHRQGFY